MADLGADRIHATKTRAGTEAFPIANGETLYVGALVALEGGYLNHYADGANDVFVGIVTGPGIGISPGGALLGNTGGTPVPQARVDCSGVTLVGLASVAGSPDATKVGDLVYCADSDTDNMTLAADSSGGDHPIGYMSRFGSASDVDVTLFTPTEMLSQATA
jgi:hypothetical protein